ncbi:MAG: hypothetical protein WA790_10160 [Sulfitobacter sp.]
MKRFFLTFCTSILLLTDHAFAERVLPADKQVCRSKFALCTSAPCVPDPSAPGDQAICTCEVTEGPNFADKTRCKDRGPKAIATIKGMAATQIISTYAFVQATTKPVMTCANDTPWTDCLNAKCIVDPKDPLKAICTCPYYDAEKSGKVATFVTYGGSCNTSTCETAVWSAATVEAFKDGSKALMEFMNIAKSDEPWAMCAGHSLDRP